MSLVHRDDFRSVCQDAPIQRTILGVLDALCGLVEARRPEQFHYLLPFLQVCVSLMEVYSGVSEVITIILKLFSLVAEYSIVWQQADCVSVAMCHFLHILPFLSFVFFSFFIAQRRSPDLQPFPRTHTSLRQEEHR